MDALAQTLVYLLLIIIIVIIVWVAYRSRSVKPSSDSPSKEGLTDKSKMIYAMERDYSLDSPETLGPNTLIPDRWMKYIFNPRDGSSPTMGGQDIQYAPSSKDDLNKFNHSTTALLPAGLSAPNSLGVEYGNGIAIPEPDVSNPKKMKISDLKKETMQNERNTPEYRFNNNAAKSFAKIDNPLSEEYIDGFTGLPDARMAYKNEAGTRPSSRIKPGYIEHYTKKEYTINTPIIY